MNLNRLFLSTPPRKGFELIRDGAKAIFQVQFNPNEDYFKPRGKSSRGGKNFRREAFKSPPGVLKLVQCYFERS